MGGDAKLEEQDGGNYHLQQGDNFTDGEEVEIWDFLREDHDGEIIFYEQSRRLHRLSQPGIVARL